MPPYTSRAQVLQQPEQPPPPRSDQKLIAQIAAALLTAYTVEQLLRMLRLPLKAAGISLAAFAAIAALVMNQPHPGLEGIGPATRYAIRVNALRQAAFTLLAARRVQAAEVAARSAGEDVAAARQAAIAAEQRYLTLHMQASTERVAAATRIDGAAAQYGRLLGWHTVRDDRTTPECAGADRKNFYVDKPPLIGFPGMLHGGTCRCLPVRPYRDAPLLPSA